MNYPLIVQVGCLCRLSLEACLHPFFLKILSLSFCLYLINIRFYSDYISDLQAFSLSVFFYLPLSLFVSVGGRYLVFTLTCCGFF